MDNQKLFKFKLSKKNYGLLQGCHFRELQYVSENLMVKFFDEECSFETNDVRELLITLNYEIVLYGLTGEDYECSEHGRALYGLYDEILFEYDKDDLKSQPD